MLEQSRQEATPSPTQPDQPTEPSGKSFSEASLVPVSQAEIQPYWQALEPLMLKVVEGMAGRHNMGTLLQTIMQGEIQLWAVVIDRDIRAVVGTELCEYPTGLRTCAIRFCGGSGFRKWVDVVLETVEQYAMENDCHRVETWARKGWQRSMPEYKMTHVMLEKDL